MANNRLLLIHKPSGLSVILGSSMGYEWGSPGDIGGFFSVLSGEDSFVPENADDFIVLGENEGRFTYSGMRSGFHVVDLEGY